MATQRTRRRRCPQCGDLITARGMSRHLHQTHGIGKTPAPTPVVGAGFVCPDCERTFPTEFGLTMHRVRMHGWRTGDEEVRANVAELLGGDPLPTGVVTIEKELVSGPVAHTPDGTIPMDDLRSLDQTLVYLSAADDADTWQLGHAEVVLVNGGQRVRAVWDGGQWRVSLNG